MKLLFITQSLDRNDPVLGFTHRWVEEFAKHCESVTVICLRKGDYSLPEHVSVYSLGKEEWSSFFTRVWRFLSYVIRLRKQYDSVFVHMNEEYVLLAGFLWKLMRKNIFMWRNHYSGSWRTDAAIAFCHNVFCIEAKLATLKKDFRLKAQRFFGTTYHSTQTLPILRFTVDTRKMEPSKACLNSSIFLT